MAQFKRLKSDVPYTPLAAWNPDGNGLQLRPEECAHTKNLRFFQKDVATRGGTSVLAFNTPSTDPILHVHNYKAPDGKEKLFGFTKNAVYSYDPTTRQWLSATTPVLFLALDDIEDTLPTGLARADNTTIISQAVAPVVTATAVAPVHITSDYGASTFEVSTYDDAGSLSTYPNPIEVKNTSVVAANDLYTPNPVINIRGAGTPNWNTQKWVATDYTIFCQILGDYVYFILSPDASYPCTNVLAFTKLDAALIDVPGNDEIWKLLNPWAYVLDTTLTDLGMVGIGSAVVAVGLDLGQGGSLGNTIHDFDLDTVILRKRSLTVDLGNANLISFLFKMSYTPGTPTYAYAVTETFQFDIVYYFDDSSQITCREFLSHTAETGSTEATSVSKTFATLINSRTSNILTGFDIKLVSSQSTVARRRIRNVSFEAYNMYTDSALPSDVYHWHTTDFIDNAKGSTVVACGSVPPAPGGEETDALSRVMYYYDPSDGAFKELEQKHQLPVVDEDTLATTPGSIATRTGGPLTNISASKTLVPGSFFLYTAEYGVIARSSTIESTFDGTKPGYALIPVDTYCRAGTSSYVLKDGSKWMVSINGVSEKESLKIYCGYDYKEVSEYKPRFVWVLNNRLVMANTYEDSMYQPWRVRWTAIGDIFSVRDIDYADLIDTDVTPIVGGDYQATNLMIYKAGSLVKARYAGDPLTYVFETVHLAGTFAGKTVKTYNHKQYFLGADDVYLWDGATAVSITMDPQRGNYRVRDKIFSILNNTKVHYCMANIYPKYQEYWLWVVRTGEDYPSSVFVYNMVRGIWFYYEFAPTTAVGLYTKRIAGSTQAKTYDELVGTYEEQNWTFEGGYLDGTTQAPILAYEAGNVYMIDDTLVSDGSYVDSSGTFVSGTQIPVELVTRDFTLGDISYQKRFSRLNFEARGTSVIVGYSDSYQTEPALFQGKTTITLDSTDQERHYFPDLVNETIRFSFEATGFFSLRWMQPQGIELDYENE